MGIFFKRGVVWEFFLLTKFGLYPDHRQKHQG
jgi:hypothetical protein